MFKFASYDEAPQRIEVVHYTTDFVTYHTSSGTRRIRRNTAHEVVRDTAEECLRWLCDRLREGLALHERRGAAIREELQQRQAQLAALESA